MATPDDRSLSSGMSLPQWMKTRMNDKLDFEQSAFSPTELDDSFIYYYRSNKMRNLSEPPNKTISAALAEQQHSYTAPVDGKKPDFSKHTLYCQKFLNNASDSTTAQKVQYPSATKTKSNGVDDGFKGEAAMCGSSVIRVAHQMVAGKVIRGFNIESQDCDAPPEGFNPALRRGSKSLPTSPLTSPSTSPKSTRRVNRYFTGPFVVENHESNGSWILSNLLARRRNVSQSMGHIAEDANELQQSNSNASIDDLSAGNKTVFIPKPSELREMNFWSPTSM